MAKRLETRFNNYLDDDKITQFVADIEAQYEKLASHKAAAAADCKPFQRRIKDIYKTAESMGVNTDALKAIIKTREYERKSQDLIDELNIGERDEYARIKDALGDYGSTPLGSAAIKQAENIVEIPRAKTVPDQVAANLERLKGIKQAEAESESEPKKKSRGWPKGKPRGKHGLAPASSSAALDSSSFKTFPRSTARNSSG